MIEDLTGAIEITQRIEAPPEIVFAYLTDSRRFTRWMGVGAELDPRPGPLPHRRRRRAHRQRRVPGSRSTAPAGDELGLGRPSDRPAGIDDRRDHIDTRERFDRAPSPPPRPAGRKRTPPALGWLEALHEATRRQPARRHPHAALPLRGREIENLSDR